MSISLVLFEVILYTKRNPILNGNKTDFSRERHLIDYKFEILMIDGGYLIYC